MNGKAVIPLLLGGGMVIASVTGCGGGQQEVYPPAAYGEVYGGVGHCYYSSSLAEATMLLSGHYCPAGWIPTPMPIWWHERYYGYYSSTRYMTIGVPHSSWGTYRTVQSSFGRTYKVQIRKQGAYARTYQPRGVVIRKTTTTRSGTRSQTGSGYTSRKSTSTGGSGYTSRRSTSTSTGRGISRTK